MKFAADCIFPITGKPILDGFVEVDDNGFIKRTGKLSEAGDHVYKYSGFIVPGFVNAHCHIELSHLKGFFKQGTGMAGFIRQINEMRFNTTLQNRLNAIKSELDNLYSQGVSAMADISNCDESFDIKASSPVYTRTFIEVFGTEKEDAHDIIEQAIKLQEKATKKGIDAAPTPHSCYTMSPELNRMSAFEGLKSGYISYHNQESKQEEDMIRFGTGELAEDYKARKLSTPPVTGNSALIYFIDNLTKICDAPFKGNVLLVHNVATDKNSINIAKKAFVNSYWVLCPLSNIFIHRELPPVKLLVENGLKICIGTDSLSSNLVLSIVDELKCLQDNFKDICLNQMLLWATLNGASALGKENILGSFDKGKKPGIVLIENVDKDNLRLTKDSVSKRLL